MNLFINEILIWSDVSDQIEMYKIDFFQNFNEKFGNRCYNENEKNKSDKLCRRHLHNLKNTCNLNN